MDQKLIDFAIERGYFKLEEIASLSQIDKDCIEQAWNAHEYSQGRQKIQRRVVTLNEKGERVLGETYFAYIGESYEEAMAREANEVDIMDVPIDSVDPIIVPFTEMATIGRNTDDNFLVVVTPDSGRNDAYFKYCNHQSYESCTAVIRLDFRAVKYYTHKGDGKELWKINNKERKSLMKFLKAKPKSKKGMAFNTNWEMAIWSWNDECGFTSDKDWDESFPEGCDPKSRLFKKPQFVPLNSPIQDYTKLEFK